MDVFLRDLNDVLGDLRPGMPSAPGPNLPSGVEMPIATPCKRRPGVLIGTSRWCHCQRWRTRDTSSGRGTSGHRPRVPRSSGIRLPGRVEVAVSDHRICSVRSRDRTPLRVTCRNGKAQNASQRSLPPNHLPGIPEPTLSGLPGGVEVPISASRIGRPCIQLSCVCRTSSESRGSSDST